MEINATSTLCHTICSIQHSSSAQATDQPAPSCIATIKLPYQLRQKCRFKHTDQAGVEFHFFLERGASLVHGDIVINEQGDHFKIEAAEEAVVSFYITDNPLLFSRCCYHLGNRHIPLQIDYEKGLGHECGTLRFQEDHVLADMLSTLGAKPFYEKTSFQPEAGAYTSHHSHHHSE